MYYAGNYRDPVTRYNHKDVSRWMRPAKKHGAIDWMMLTSGSIVCVCVASLVAIGMIILQAA